MGFSMRFARVAHHPGYENSVIFKAESDPSVAVAALFASSAVMDFITSAESIGVESKLNFLHTNTIEDFYECVLVLGHELQNTIVCALVEDQLVARELEARLRREGVASETNPSAFQMRQATIVVSEWARADEQTNSGMLLVVSPGLLARHDEIMARDASFGLARRYILFHQMSTLEINFGQ